MSTRELWRLRKNVRLDIKEPGLEPAAEVGGILGGSNAGENNVE
jgi:hypothetical protein